jgi:hypothetical protein
MARYQIYICGGDPVFEIPNPECPNADRHTSQPKGYSDWHEWARQMAKGFKQKRCAGCGRFNIWEPRGTRS